MHNSLTKIVILTFMFQNLTQTIFQDLFVHAWSNTFFSFISMFASEGLGGNLSVVCGSQLGRKTTRLIYPTTSTTRLSSPSSVVSSMELIATSAINKNNLDVTMSTADILSEELKCDHRYIYISIYFTGT